MFYMNGFCKTEAGNLLQHADLSKKRIIIENDFSLSYIKDE